MGAWGAGLQANDTALDVIDGDELPEILGTQSGPELYTYLQSFKEWGGEWTVAVLGAAEWLLDQHLPLMVFTESQSLLAEAIAYEREEIGCWKDQIARRSVLDLFEMRLRGEVVSQDAIDVTNEGLLSKFN